MRNLVDAATYKDFGPFVPFLEVLQKSHARIANNLKWRFASVFPLLSLLAVLFVQVVLSVMLLVQMFMTLYVYGVVDCFVV